MSRGKRQKNRLKLLLPKEVSLTEVENGSLTWDYSPLSILNLFQNQIE